MHVRLKVVSDVDPPIAPQVVTLDPQHDELLWTVRLPMTRPHRRSSPASPGRIVRQRGTISTRCRSSAIRCSCSGLTAAPPAIVVQPSLDWTGTTQLSSKSGTRTVTTRSIACYVLAHQKLAAQRVEFALIDPQKRAYRWHGTFFKADGTTAETPPVETDRGLIVVTMPHAAGTDVRIMWVGAPGAAAGLRVDFWTMLPSARNRTSRCSCVPAPTRRRRRRCPPTARAPCTIATK